MDLAHFQALFDSWGYFFLFVYSLGSGYVGLVLAAILSATGHMDITKTMLVAGLGNFVGSCLLVWLGRTQKKEMRSYLHKHRRKLALVHIWIHKYGAWLIFFNKYIYGVKTLVPLAIGLSKFSFKQFVGLNALSCALWALSLGEITFHASAWVRRSLDEGNAYPYLLPVLFIISLVGLWLWISKISQKTKKD
ncbi:DedA family protein [Helicobacter sp. NHP22-001]|uniref:DedA family protein n=1 Tax=Helicobacter sp. NHP22-001 TaxID=3040202 RepID=UPI00244D993C|nr:DedA family protein [Helicobacter sp. NHP22-001]GMB96525.1 Ubiquitous DedA transporter family [Helicobacter sp. NHP22-001]